MSNRADLLEQAIRVLDTADQGNTPCVLPNELAVALGFQPGEVIANSEYDRLRNELTRLNPSCPLLQTPTAAEVDLEEDLDSDLETTTVKVVHNPPLTSIKKASHEVRSIQEEELWRFLYDATLAAPEALKTGWNSHPDKFYRNIIVTYPDLFYEEYKLDGVACAIYYDDDGNLLKAGLRPRDGVNGEDVTEQIQYVKGVPKKLKTPLGCSVRGEIVCLQKDFDLVQKELEEAGEDARANPRNHAAGGIRQFKEPQKVKQMRLTFIAYGIEGVTNPPWKTEIERARYANEKLGLIYIGAKKFNFDDLAVMEKQAKTLPFETDGVIIGINDMALLNKMGRHGDTPTGNPRGKIAWKYEEEKAEVEIKSITWQTGRGGGLTPVANFDAVKLAGTMVSRATLHNIGFMMRKGIGVETIVRIMKAGKIIPKVIAVVSSPKNLKFDYPHNCPSCDSVTRVVENGEMAELMCENHNNCPAQNIGTLVHFLATLGVLGLGESRIEQLTASLKVKKSADLYALTEQDCIYSGMSERQSLLALAAIHMVDKPDKTKDNDKLRTRIENARKVKKVIPLWKLFAAFGVDTAGKQAGKAMMEHFRDFDRMRSASVEELESIQDIGLKTAEIIHRYFIVNRQNIDALLQHIQPELPSEGPLTGKTYCLSGDFPDGGKSAWEAMIEKKGGKCSSSVGKRTSFLVQGENAGAGKDTKAKSYGVPIISIDDLRKQLE
jgi:DNA ligase (NAD+)